MKQTLCPYTTNPLAQSAATNKEHILPVAIGAPASFYVQADAMMNGQMNEEIDAPFSNDPIIRFLAMSHGVTSRSGAVTAKVRGEATATSDSVDVVFSKDAIEMRFVKPIELDPESGTVSAVKGFGSQAADLAAIIQRNYEKKGSTVELDESISSPDSSLKLQLSCDLDLLQQQLIKISYLSTVRIWGDRAITSTSGQMYREGIRSVGEDALGKIGFLGGKENLLPPVLRRPDPHEHLVVTFVQGELLVSVITLFGTFTACFMSPSDGLGASESEGEYIIIDASTSTLVSRSFVEELSYTVRRR
jgi:hypothetical protein